jgi:amino acid transporter
MVSYTSLNVAAPVAVAIDVTHKPWLMTLVKLGVICGFTSVILVMLLGQSRVFYSMSRDGLVPKVFSEIHPRFRTPYRSNMLFAVFAAVLAAFLPLQVVGEMTSIGTLFAFVIVCGVVWIMRRKQPDVHRPFKTPLVPLIPILGMVWNFAMMYALGSSNWTRLVVWLVIGQILFFTYGRRHSKLTAGKQDGGRLVDHVLTAANVGFLAGGVAGFLARPATPMGAKLGFEAVVERGLNLKDPVLIDVAKASFSGMAIYALCGAAVAALVGYVLHRALSKRPAIA